MKKYSVCSFLAAALLASTLSVFAEEPVEGTINEIGWGKFRLTDKDNTIRAFSESKQDTKYDPSDWRPAVGDLVSAAYTKVEQRSGAVLRVDTLKLVKAGPNTVIVKSPAEILITEVGKTAIRGKVLALDKEARFSRSRETKMSPDGWTPAAGEKARVEFTARASPVTFGITYVIEKMEKIVAEAPKAPAAEPAKTPDAK